MRVSEISRWRHVELLHGKLGNMSLHDQAEFVRVGLTSRNRCMGRFKPPSDDRSMKVKPKRFFNKETLKKDQNFLGSKFLTPFCNRVQQETSMRMI